MDKVIELARKAAAQNGDTLKDVPEKETVEFIQAFYTLARADLEAENANLGSLIETQGIVNKAIAMKLVESEAENERLSAHMNELRALHAQRVEALEAELLEQARIVGMGGERELKLMAENAKLTETIKSLNSALTNTSRGNAKLREVLEKLARLGNGDHYGNSDGNMIARAALGEK